MTKLQNAFERYGISIENVFLFDYFLTKPISSCNALNDVLDMMPEAETRQIFGDSLAKRIMAEDPDLAAYFQEAGGVFISGECDFPDWQHVDFAPGTDEPKSWHSGCGRRIIYAYAPNLQDALNVLATEAAKVEEEELSRAIAARKTSPQEDKK